jgi:hypothetical protein
MKLHLLNLPELNIAVFAFLMNFFWEVQQMPFFRLPLELSCQGRILNCTVATIGDVGIALLGFWTVGAIYRSRHWLNCPRWQQVGIFVGVGIIITIIFEALATGVLNQWEYASFMPTLPWLGTGVLPILQWTLIPPIVIWFAKRQLASA